MVQLGSLDMRDVHQPLNGSFAFLVPITEQGRNACGHRQVITINEFFKLNSASLQKPNTIKSSGYSLLNYAGIGAGSAVSVLSMIDTLPAIAGIIALPIALTSALIKVTRPSKETVEETFPINPSDFFLYTVTTSKDKAIDHNPHWGKIDFHSGSGSLFNDDIYQALLEYTREYSLYEHISSTAEEILLSLSYYLWEQKQIYDRFKNYYDPKYMRKEIQKLSPQKAHIIKQLKEATVESSLDKIDPDYAAFKEVTT